MAKLAAPAIHHSAGMQKACPSLLHIREELTGTQGK